MQKEMTANELKNTISDAFCRWEELSLHGCSDPQWPDGVNMNLVRNHIIYYQQLLAEYDDGQYSMFSDSMSEQTRELPPLVPDGYMVKDGEYFQERYARLKSSFNLVFEEGVSV